MRPNGKVKSSAGFFYFPAAFLESPAWDIFSDRIIGSQLDN